MCLKIYSYSKFKGGAHAGNYTIRISLDQKLFPTYGAGQMVQLVPEKILRT
jgi:hypothetical protein